MNEGTVRPAEAQRFEEACEWFLKLREESESGQSVAEWLEWLRSDARNRAAFEEVRQLWRATECLAVEATAPSSLEQATAITKPPSLRYAEKAIDRRRRGRAVRGWSPALAAALIALGAGIFWMTRAGQTNPDVEVSSFSTARSEHRSFLLRDGSRIELAGDSRVKATLRDNIRSIELLQGEAYFQVAHDKQRPFVVHTGTLQVRAVGTRFDVRTSGDRVVVAVEEGMVVVEHHQQAASAVESMLTLLRPQEVRESRRVALRPVSLRGGQEIAVGGSAQELQLMPIEPTAVASWREGRLRFAREPLHAVIASIRAATGRDIEIADPALGELRFTGTVFSSHVEAWVAGLPAIFPVTVRQDGAQLIIAPRN